MEKLVHVARISPTAMNAQKLIFRVFLNKEAIAKMEAAAEPTISQWPNMVERKKALGINSCLIYDAPACILITFPKTDNSVSIFFSLVLVTFHF
jgi:hypothetical protein